MGISILLGVILGTWLGYWLHKKQKHAAPKDVRIGKMQHVSEALNGYLEKKLK